MANKPGTCRFCGCTDDHACMIPSTGPYGDRPCSWATNDRTLCTNPDCLQKDINSREQAK